MSTPPRTHPKTPGLAITSLVCGIAGFLTCLLTGIPAIITGHLALGRIKKDPSRFKGSGTAMTGLVLGYVTTVGTIFLIPLAALATPAVYKALERARSAENTSHAPTPETPTPETPTAETPTTETPTTEAPTPATPPSPLYTTAPPSRDGTGKFYLGREIAHVMGHQAINWLERDNREEEEAPSRAVAGLQLAPDAVIADIGAGSGYYTFKLSPLVPQGKVVAVDIQQEMIDHLEKREKELGLTNVEAHLGTIDSVKLPPNSIDAALFVDAYHEFSHPWEMMQSIVTALRPGGRVFLLEYRAEDASVPIKPLHKMSQEQAVLEMTTAGLTHLRTDDFLPWQHFMVFEKPQVP